MRIDSFQKYIQIKNNLKIAETSKARRIIKNYWMRIIAKNNYNTIAYNSQLCVKKNKLKFVRSRKSDGSS